MPDNAMSHKGQFTRGEPGAVYETRQIEVKVTRIVRSRRGFLATSLRDGQFFFINALGHSLSSLRTGDVVAVQLKARVVYEEAVFAPGLLTGRAGDGLSHSLALGRAV